MSRPMLVVSLLMMLFIFCYHTYPLITLICSLVFIVGYMIIEIFARSGNYSWISTLTPLHKNNSVNNYYINKSYNIIMWLIILCLFASIFLYELSVSEHENLYNNNFKYEIDRLINDNINRIFKSTKIGEIRQEIRAFIKLKILENLDYDNARLAMGIFLGDKKILDKEIKHLFVISGTAHILVVSGLHFGIIYSILLFVFSKVNINYKLSQITTMIVMFSFLFMVGLSFSPIRALFMILMHSLSVFCKRRYDLLNSLGVVLFISILYNPLCVFSVGLQMSVIAVVAIGFYNLYIPILKRKFKFANSVFFDIFALPIAIQLALMPHGIYHFHKIYPYGFIFNVPVIILMPMLMMIMIIFVGVISAKFMPYFVVKIISFIMDSFFTVLSDIVSFSKILPYNVIKLTDINAIIPIILYLGFIILAINPQIIDPNIK